MGREVSVRAGETGETHRFLAKSQEIHESRILITILYNLLYFKYIIENRVYMCVWKSFHFH